MEKELFSDLIQSLNEAVEHAHGDQIKGRSVIVTIPDNEVEMDQVILHQLGRLSMENKEKIIQYANELLRVSS